MSVEYSPQRASKNTFIDETKPSKTINVISKRIGLATRMKMLEKGVEWEKIQVNLTFNAVNSISNLCHIIK